MTERTIWVRLKADIANFRKQFDDASGVIQKNSAHISGLSNQVGLLGAGMVAVAGIAVAKFAEFDAAMSNVAATGDDARGSIDQLRQAAIDAGQRTVYSATEAAGAIESLAKAGVSATDILGGGLDGALDLAAAGSIDVADAAEIAATAMTQFGLSGQDVTHVADLLAAGAGKAQGGVEDLGMALKQSGQVADMTGLTIEETTAALAAFASAGLLGSDAGTSFKSMLQRLTPQSAEAQQAMDELGISAYDSQGQFIGLAKFAGNLQTAMQDLTPEARNAAMATIFGSDAVRAATVLYDQGEQGIRDWTAAVDDQGYAAEVAATRLDNLKGDWEQFTGALDTALIGMGEGANGPLRQLTQEATNVVNAFSDLPAAAQGALLSIIGGGGLVLLGAAGLGKLVVAVNDAKIAMQAIGITAKTASIAVAGIGGALAIGTLALTSWASAAAEARARTEEYAGTLDEFGKVTDDTMSVVNSALSKDRTSGLAKFFGADSKSLIDEAKRYGVAISDLQGYILGSASAVAKVNGQLETYAQKNADSQLDVERAREETGNFTSALDEQSSALTEAQKQQGQKVLADQKSAEAEAQTAAATELTTGAVDEQVDALAELVEGLSKAAGHALSVRDAQAGLEQAYDDATAAIATNGQTLDITTQAGRDNQAALDDIAQSGWDLIDSMQANGATQAELQAAMAGTREKFVEVAQSMGLSADQANALADELGLIPTNVQVAVNADTSQANAAVDALSYKLDHLNGRTVTTNVRTNEQTVTTGRSNAIAQANGGYIVGAGTGTSDSIPAWLSNGEYVIKASAVSQYGRGFFDSLNSQRFAVGGPVGTVATSRSQSGASGPVVAMGDVTLVAADPYAALNEFDRRLRFEAAGRP